MLSTIGINARVLSMHTIKPLDTKAILAAAVETKAIFTIEEHSIIGGLGAAVAQALADLSVSVPCFQVGLDERFLSQVGSQEYILKVSGLASEKIVASVSAKLRHALTPKR
jgi:transketolase